MTHETKTSRLPFLPPHGGFAPARTRRERRQQYRQQMLLLAIGVVVTVLVGAIVIAANWARAHDQRDVSCDEYPQFCVPFAAADAGSAFKAFEAPGARALDNESHGSPGVVRGMTAEGRPFIGNPDAPIRIAVVSDYACSHCQQYDATVIEPLINEYALSGQAVFEENLVNTIGLDYSALANQAAFCAGEQGAFWEFSSAMFRRAKSEGVVSAFSQGALEEWARQMGLDAAALRTCLRSQTYAPLLGELTGWSYDHGVTGTPTVFMRLRDEATWTRVSTGGPPSYLQLADAIESAQP